MERVSVFYGIAAILFDHYLNWLAINKGAEKGWESVKLFLIEAKIAAMPQVEAELKNLVTQSLEGKYRFRKLYFQCNDKQILTHSYEFTNAYRSREYAQNNLDGKRRTTRYE